MLVEDGPVVSRSSLFEEEPPRRCENRRVRRLVRDVEEDIHQVGPEVSKGLSRFLPVPARAAELLREYAFQEHVPE